MNRPVKKGSNQNWAEATETQGTCAWPPLTSVDRCSDASKSDERVNGQWWALVGLCFFCIVIGGSWWWCQNHITRFVKSN
jgi:hypothetical protein